MAGWKAGITIIMEQDLSYNDRKYLEEGELGSKTIDQRKRKGGAVTIATAQDSF